MKKICNFIFYVIIMVILYMAFIPMVWTDRFDLPWNKWHKEKQLVMIPLIIFGIEVLVLSGIIALTLHEYHVHMS
jgi:hypothetical protein